MKDIRLADRFIAVAVIGVVGGSCRARAWGFVDLEAGGGRHGEVCRRCHASDCAIMVLASRARPGCHREEQEQAGEPQAEMRTGGHRIRRMQRACLERRGRIRPAST